MDQINSKLAELIVYYLKMVLGFAIGHFDDGMMKMEAEGLRWIS